MNKFDSNLNIKDLDKLKQNYNICEEIIINLTIEYKDNNISNTLKKLYQYITEIK